LTQHNADQVAFIAATLLQGRFDAEPHQISKAVATARVILDAAQPAEEPEALAPLASTATESGETHT